MKNRVATIRKNIWTRTPSGKWRLGHKPGSDFTENPLNQIDKIPLDPPNGPTTERLTIQPLDGLSALETKYADDLKHGRALSNRFD